MENIEARDDWERRVLAMSALSDEMKKEQIEAHRKRQIEFQEGQAKWRKEMEESVLEPLRREAERLRAEGEAAVGKILSDALNTYAGNIQKIREDFKRKTGRDLPQF